MYHKKDILSRLVMVDWDFFFRNNQENMCGDSDTELSVSPLFVLAGLVSNDRASNGRKLKLWLQGLLDQFINNRSRSRDTKRIEMGEGAWNDLYPAVMLMQFYAIINKDRGISDTRRAILSKYMVKVLLLIFSPGGHINDHFYIRYAHCRLKKVFTLFEINGAETHVLLKKSHTRLTKLLDHIATEQDEFEQCSFTLAAMDKGKVDSLAERYAALDPNHNETSLVTDKLAEPLKTFLSSLILEGEKDTQDTISTELKTMMDQMRGFCTPDLFVFADGQPILPWPVILRGIIEWVPEKTFLRSHFEKYPAASAFMNDNEALFAGKFVGDSDAEQLRADQDISFAQASLDDRQGEDTLQSSRKRLQGLLSIAPERDDVLDGEDSEEEDFVVFSHIDQPARKLVRVKSGWKWLWRPPTVRLTIDNSEVDNRYTKLNKDLRSIWVTKRNPILQLSTATVIALAIAVSNGALIPGVIMPASMLAILQVAKASQALCQGWFYRMNRIVYLKQALVEEGVTEDEVAYIEKNRWNKIDKVEVPKKLSWLIGNTDHIHAKISEGSLWGRWESILSVSLVLSALPVLSVYSYAILPSAVIGYAIFSLARRSKQTMKMGIQRLRRSRPLSASAVAAESTHAGHRSQRRAGLAPSDTTTRTGRWSRFSWGFWQRSRPEGRQVREERQPLYNGSDNPELVGV